MDGCQFRSHEFDTYLSIFSDINGRPLESILVNKRVGRILELTKLSVKNTSFYGFGESF